MSREKLKGRCSICRNLVVQVRRYPVFPAPELPFPPQCKCKSTNETIAIDDVETERACEHFVEIKDQKALMEREFELSGIEFQ